MLKVNRFTLLFVGILLLQGCGAPTDNAKTYNAADYNQLITAEKLRKHLQIIAADSMEGRAFGSEGLDKAASYIASQYQQAGLNAATGGNSAEDFYQPLSELVNEDCVSSQNILAFIKGTDEVLKEEAIIVTAHYDHLGVNDTLSGDQIFNGAADNASGVTASLVLAEVLMNARNDGMEFRRSIVFLNTTGEEKQGRAGSRYYIQQDPLFPLNKTTASINMDGVGGQDTTNLPSNNNYVYIVSEDSTSVDLKNLNAEVNKQSGINLELSKPPFAFGSDQMAFQGYLIPSIYFSTGLTSNYHKVSDHSETIDYEHMQKIVQLIFAVVWELANAENPTPSFVRADYEAVPGEYVCRPCGCTEHPRIFTAVGTCPACNMVLIPNWRKKLD